MPWKILDLQKNLNANFVHARAQIACTNQTMENTNPKQTQAKSLYFISDLTHQQIADVVGVHRKTLYTWIKDGHWTRTRNTDNLTPMRVIQQYYTMIENYNAAIFSRRDKYPDEEDAKIIRSLASTIKALTPKQPKNHYASVIYEFLTEFARQDPALSEQIKPHLIQFVASKDSSFPLEDFFTPSNCTTSDNQSHASFSIPPLSVPSNLSFGERRGEATYNQFEDKTEKSVPSSLSPSVTMSLSNEGRGEATNANDSPAAENNQISREEFKDIVKFVKQFQENTKDEPDPEIPSDEEQLEAWSQFTNTINSAPTPALPSRSPLTIDAALNVASVASNYNNKIIENSPKRATVKGFALRSKVLTLHFHTPSQEKLPPKQFYVCCDGSVLKN